MSLLMKTGDINHHQFFNENIPTHSHAEPAVTTSEI
jgi:hypothetical protein